MCFMYYVECIFEVVVSVVLFYMVNHIIDLYPKTVFFDDFHLKLFNFYKQLNIVLFSTLNESYVHKQKNVPPDFLFCLSLSCYNHPKLYFCVFCINYRFSHFSTQYLLIPSKTKQSGGTFFRHTVSEYCLQI